MGKVVYLDAQRPHLSGTARCLSCQHQWAAVSPVGTVWLACPSCLLLRGRYVNYCEIEKAEHWTCHCGCDLFFVTPGGMYCPNCGTVQRF